MYIMKFVKENSAGYMTNWLARSFAKAMAARLAPYGLTTAHLPIYFALMNQQQDGDGAGLTQKELAELAGIEQPTMAATLSRMKRDGLINTVPNPTDGRSVLLVLTKKSLEKSGHIKSAVQEINQKALSGLSKTEQMQFLNTLSVMIKSLES